MELCHIDFIEIYVSNLLQSVFFYQHALGFTPIAYGGLETKWKDVTSCILRQNEIYLVLTSPLHAQSPIAQHIKLQGDSVRDIVFYTQNVEKSFNEAVKNGAIPCQLPTIFKTEQGTIIKGSVKAYGSVIHSFIQRESSDFCLPNYQWLENAAVNASQLTHIDHIAICVEAGQMNSWVNYYQQCFGFLITHEEDVMTEYSGMHSKVVQSHDGKIKFPINEPGSGKRKSQIEEFLYYNNGVGVQHIAFSTNDILESVIHLKQKGIGFLDVPPSYYDIKKQEITNEVIRQKIDEFTSSQILIDQDNKGYLFQIFSKPIQSRPTFFFELIQREGALGFGSGNIKSLFLAVEQEQQKRGTL